MSNDIFKEQKFQHYYIRVPRGEDKHAGMHRLGCVVVTAGPDEGKITRGISICSQTEPEWDTGTARRRAIGRCKRAFAEKRDSEKIAAQNADVFARLRPPSVTEFLIHFADELGRYKSAYNVDPTEREAKILAYLTPKADTAEPIANPA